MEKLTKCSEFNKAIKFNTIANLQKQDANLMAKKFELSINLAMVTNEAFTYFKSAECKELLKSLDVKIDAKGFAEYIGMSKSYMYLLCQASSVAPEKLNEYRDTKDEKSLKNLVKFANPSDASDTEEQTDGTEEQTDGKVKVKQKTFKATAKDGKIVIEGDAEENDLRMLIAEINKMIEAKVKAKSESKAA